jgi:hypothetical protein
MARKKNASFVGVPLGEVARDASIYARTIGNAAGDFALTFDKVTGANSHSSSDTINHSGGVRGCPMRMPYPSQTIGRNLGLVGAATEAEYYILVLPIFKVLTGITESWNLEVDLSLRAANQEVVCEVRSSTWALVTGGSYVGARDTANVAGDERYRRVSFRITLDQTISGWVYLAVRCPLYLDDLDPSALIEGWRLSPDWTAAGESNGLAIPGAAAVGDPYPTHATTMTPTNAAANDIDAAMVAVDAPLDAWVLTRLNRMLNSTWEYLTGSPTPGNNTRVMTSTRNHNRSTFTAEPLLEFPVASVALGCMRVSSVTVKTNFLGTLSTSAPIVGPINWVRYPQTTAANEVAIATRTIVYFPPFSTSSSDLEVVLLALDYSTGGAGTWEARVSTTGGSSAWATFAQLGSTNLWAATMTAVPFSAGASNIFAIDVRNTAGGAIGGRELLLLSYGVAFTP